MTRRSSFGRWKKRKVGDAIGKWGAVRMEELSGRREGRGVYAAKRPSASRKEGAYSVKYNTQHFGRDILYLQTFIPRLVQALKSSRQGIF
jgi:hypothetical protein